MLEMNPVQNIPHSNPKYSGLFLGTKKLLAHSCRGREKEEGQESVQRERVYPTPSSSDFVFSVLTSGLERLTLATPEVSPAPVPRVPSWLLSCSSLFLILRLPLRFGEQLGWPRP